MNIEKSRRKVVATCIAAATALSSFSTSIAFADEARHEFHIKPQRLESALREFGMQSGEELLYGSALTANLDTDGVDGYLSSDEALSALLVGSALTFHRTGSGAVTLEKLRPESQHSSPRNSDSATLPKVTVRGSAVDAFSPYNSDYARSNTTVATKTDTPLMETPVSVRVVPQQVIKDQMAIQLNKAAENISGVYRGSFGSDNGADHFIIRGFQSDMVYRDGVPFESSSFLGNEETANIEQIEVLKGPASILYGRTEPGGMVNMVTKKPLSEPYYAISQQFGSFDYYRTTADATGPVAGNSDLLYRFNMAYLNRGSFRKYTNGEDVFLAPVLHWRISERTQLNLEMQYRRSSDPFTYGWPAIGNRPAKLPRSFNVSGPWAKNSNMDGYLAGVNWSHAFNDNWTLTHRFTTQLAYGDAVKTGYQYALAPDNRTLSRLWIATDDAESERYYTSLNLTGKFDTWGISHTLLLGADYLNTNLKGTARNGVWSDLDLFNPIDRIPPHLDPANDFAYDNHTDWYGLYLQDQLKLPYHFHFMGGFRYDNVVSSDNKTEQTTEAADKASPRVGLLWNPVPEFSVYSSYTENFGVASGGIGRRGNLPAEGAQQWEVGVKSEWLDGRLSATAAYYDLTKQNVAIPDPTDNTGTFSVPVGEVNNSGVELDVAGELLPGWKLIGAYSYIDSNITKSNDGTEGNRLANVPKHGGSLWSTYEFQADVLQGLKLGAGVVARGQRPGDNENTFQVPGFATVNLMAAYQWRVGKSLVTTQLNIDNLADKYYFGSAGFNALRANIASPRTVLGTLKVEF